MKKRALAVIVMITVVIAAIPYLAVLTEADMTLTQSKMGTYDGYDYEFWTDVSPNSSSNKATMVLKGAGSFTSEYDTLNNKNTLMRTGKKFGNPNQLHGKYGNIYCEYDVDYQPGGTGASYMCIYGWTRRDNNAPLVEFYVVEDWGAWRPPGGSAKSRVTIGGVQYDIYETDRINQPSIEGDTTFKQYWSVRVNKPTRGSNGNIKATVNVSDHFKAWEGLGMKMGTLYEVSLCIEGFNSTGKANVKKHVLTWGGSGPQTTATTKPVVTTTTAKATTTVPATTNTPTPTTPSGTPTVIYDMQSDLNLANIAPSGGSHPIFYGAGGTRSVNTASVPKTLTITQANASSGIDIKIKGLNAKPNHSYRFDISGSHGTTANTAMRFESRVNSTGETLITPNPVTNSSGNFSFSYNTNYTAINALMAADAEAKYRIRSDKEVGDLVIKGVIITAFCPSGCTACGPLSTTAPQSTTVPTPTTTAPIPTTTAPATTTAPTPTTPTQTTTVPATTTTPKSTTTVPATAATSELITTVPATTTTPIQTTTEPVTATTPIPTTTEPVTATTPIPTPTEPVTATTPKPTTIASIITTTAESTTTVPTTTTAPTTPVSSGLATTTPAITTSLTPTTAPLTTAPSAATTPMQTTTVSATAITTSPTTTAPTVTTAPSTTTTPKQTTTVPATTITPTPTTTAPEPTTAPTPTTTALGTSTTTAPTTTNPETTATEPTTTATTSTPPDPDYVLGRILDKNAEPEIFDALEVLKCLVGMDNKATGNPAALITAESRVRGTPSIFDALEILKYLVGMDNLIDSPV